MISLILFSFNQGTKSQQSADKSLGKISAQGHTLLCSSWIKKKQTRNWNCSFVLGFYGKFSNL